jgi:hypothetical protein
MITEDITREVAEAEVTDDCRVSIFVADLSEKDVAVLTASQARLLAAELTRAAGEAERAAEELLGEREPARFDVAILSPDCRDGKDAACVGTAWDVAADRLTDCGCDCHAKAGAA